MRFRRPAFSDVTVEIALAAVEAARIAAEAQQSGKAEFTLHAALKDAEAHVVAGSEGAYQRRKIGH